MSFLAPTRELLTVLQASTVPHITWLTSPGHRRHPCFGTASTRRVGIACLFFFLVGLSFCSLFLPASFARVPLRPFGPLDGHCTKRSGELLFKYLEVCELHLVRVRLDGLVFGFQSELSSLVSAPQCSPFCCLFMALNCSFNENVAILLI